MAKGNRAYDLAGVTAATLIGILPFFVIIGVFGLQFAIAGLVVFAFSAVHVFRVFPGDGADL
jgi:hypothetical protein